MCTAHTTRWSIVQHGILEVDTWKYEHWWQEIINSIYCAANSNKCATFSRRNLTDLFCTAFCNDLSRWMDSLNASFIHIINLMRLKFRSLADIKKIVEKCADICSIEAGSPWQACCLWGSHGQCRMSKTVEVRIMQPSAQSSPMTLVSLRLTSAQNSKGNIGSRLTRGAE